MTILLFQQMWGATGDMYLYSEQLKPLPYALNQVTASGNIARAGVSAAVALIMISVPILIFVINQSQIVETMGTAGLKD